MLPIVLPDFAGSQFNLRLVKALTQGNLPWAYRTGTMWPGYALKARDPNAYDSPQLVHPLHDNGVPRSELCWAVDRLCGRLTEREGVYTENIHRSKINLNMPNPMIPEGGHYMPHVDMPVTPHTVALYYPIDSDGDTVFFVEVDGALEEVGRVTPVADTLIYFDGSMMHAAEPPRKMPVRFSLNITLINKGY